MDRRSVSDRFLREIQNAGQLHHPNLVTAYTAIRAGDRIVLAMEYVEGLDLARLVATQGPLPVAHACNFIYQAALGLQHAHERGWSIATSSRATSYSLARERRSSRSSTSAWPRRRSEGQSEGGLTREGQMLGTPDYLAPEQIRDAQRPTSAPTSTAWVAPCIAS